MPWNFLHWSWCYCRYTIFVLQSYLFYNPALLSHFTSYQTGFYIAARWYFSLNHWTSQRFDHPGHAEKHWRLWLAGINNHWELHPRMQSNNQRRSWQLPALERKKKTIGSISKLLLTESEYFPAFPEWLLQNWVFSWVIIIKLGIFSLSFSSGTARRGRMLTWPPKHLTLSSIRTRKLLFLKSLPFPGC